MAIMHESEPYGYLRIGERQVTEKHSAFLATLVRATEADVRRGLKELRDAGVFSVDANGTIFSRRMVRDEVSRQSESDRNVSRRSPVNGQFTADLPVQVPGTVNQRFTGVLPDHPSAGGRSRTNTRIPEDQGTPDSPSGESAPPAPRDRRTRPSIEPGPTFGEYEPTVLAFMALLASANTTGTIADSRVQNTRREIAALAKRFGFDAVLYGLSECLRREKPALEYARACAARYRPDGEQVAAPRRLNPGPVDIPAEERR